MPEYFDLLDENGNPTGERKERTAVHRDGDWHRAVHVWIFVRSTGELLLQKRASCKESWAGMWDISCAGHITSGFKSLLTAQRELQEELGLELPQEAFEPLFVYKQQSTDRGGAFINNEFNDVYLVTLFDRLPKEAFILQDDEVEDVKYVGVEELFTMYIEGRDDLVAADVKGEYGKLFQILRKRLSGSSGIQGSGVGSQMVQIQDGGGQIEMKYLLFDSVYLNIPPEHR
eukprot:TRINITY_DN1935_c1_g1_i1.p3 TRINITY_DN1935_c1_g1~~TRINITY_DN1935_c1_g1_i1.p3  ORF type:complete len:230 (-),score=47.41 TRINITY_DN1935_c1_g1_i1:311-1000(-)